MEQGPASTGEERLRVECVESLVALEAHGDAWDALAASLPQGIPMMSHAWVATHLERKLRPEERWLALLAYDGTTLLGVLTVVLSKHRALGFSRVVARIPGDYHTAEDDLVLRPDREAETLAALLAELRRRVPRLLRVVAGLVRGDSPTVVALRSRPKGFVVTRSVEAWGSTFAIRGGVEEWRRSLSDSLRSDMRRGENRAKREGLLPIEHEVLTGKDASPDLVEEFLEIEATGWKGREGVALAKRPETLDLYRALARRFAARGRLEWQFLRFGGRYGGRRAAAQMLVRSDRSLMVLRVAYDETLSKCGPGNLLLLRTVEREFERGSSDEVNLVTDWPWCRRWRMDVRPYERVAFHPLRPLPLLVGVLPAVARAAARRVPGARALVRRLRGPPKAA